ncbi:hypothetical protein A2714_02960 [Candidatus Woesebacteria bacterium RIFCSPHIGHO2_01_FULL_38_9]|uniref:Uncharacterized protein n=2 Tax=Candidatus Woeseibacteriota TaxID=1752722 RepID=A0A1F7XZ20_9BACT|nr:MAG: hypothetical protein A2714_02960 [Candidatus Woesebacteria bacterium RIFCSPHIGHO2_01_FULL_38_9]OGM58888.1 MAG: hypothetical protein A3A75_06525 [Candidatus Woesebacteria bacterium RIFCSPLOWO2_01_FULL_39_10]
MTTELQAESIKSALIRFQNPGSGSEAACVDCPGCGLQICTRDVMQEGANPGQVEEACVGYTPFGFENRENCVLHVKPGSGSGEGPHDGTIWNT